MIHHGTINRGLGSYYGGWSCAEASGNRVPSGTKLIPSHRIFQHLTASYLDASSRNASSSRSAS